MTQSRLRHTESRPGQPRSASAPDRRPDESEIAEIERKRIGREFHDGIGQKLTSVSVAASILVEKLEERGLPEANDARRLLRLIRETVRDARNLARGLNPASLLHKGLENALDELLAEVRESTSFETELHIQDWKPVQDEQTALHVFRIVQEAVHNAVKHCEGRTITVTLAAENGEAFIEIADDGKGLPEDVIDRDGMGFDLMSQRARALGGSLDTHSGADGGTAVRCSFAMMNA